MLVLCQRLCGDPFLWELVLLFINSVHEQLNFTLLLPKILWSLIKKFEKHFCNVGPSSSIKCRIKPYTK